MKPLFTKMEKEIYVPGDPRRKAFEEQWRLAGGNPEEMEGQTIEVENDEIDKVTTFKYILCIEMFHQSPWKFTL